MSNLFVTIEDFLEYGVKNLDLNPFDVTYVRNQIYSFLKCYPDKDIPSKTNEIHDVNYFVEYFLSYFNKQGQDDITANINLSYLFSLISLIPSSLVDRFNKIYSISPRKAVDYLYKYGVNNYYIHLKDINRNLEWTAKYNDSPDVEITINLSKPEKDNKDIMKLVSGNVTSSYPKCVLCLENLGFEGNIKKAPRHNIRIFPLKLNGENWFMQYSPYGYFKEHMILVDYIHENMEISPRIYKLLFAFNEKFPFYTIGSNSDLPIVGGSILNHEHFQGGNHIFPLQKAKDLFVIKSKKFKSIKISYLDFYNSSFKFVGKDKDEIIRAASLLLSKWRKYSNEEIDIIAYSDDKIHNTTTPILRRNSKGEYEFILILRNNAVSEKYPDGIFHVHPEYFMIKKEGIGLIEAMGRFILPARLLRQIKEVDEVLSKPKLSEKAYLKKYPDLIIFTSMINTLRANPKLTAKDYINDVARNILKNTAVFKDDEKGRNALKEFIKFVNF